MAPFEVGLNILTCICLEKEINFEQGEREKERQKDVLVSLPSVGAGKEKRGRERRVNYPRGIPLGHSSLPFDSPESFLEKHCFLEPL